MQSTDATHSSPPQPDPNARLKKGFRDLLLSMAVVTAAVGFLVLVVWRPAPEAVRVADPGPMLESARFQADYPVAAPVGLNADWRATSARFSANADGSTTWFLGYVTPEDQYIAVTQTDGEPEAFVSEQTIEGTSEGTVVVAGRTWEKFGGSQQSLVLQEPGVTTVVTGTASFDDLAAFVDRLESS